METAGIEPAPCSPRCEEWTGALNSKGYGVRTIDGKSWLAHRAAYVEAHGPIPPNSHVHHTCGNRRCVAPAHLKAITALEHNREHMPGPSATEIIEAELASGEPRSRRELVAAAKAAGISGNAVDTALSRMSVRRIGRGLYQDAA